jgi:hypothetical protein
MLIGKSRLLLQRTEKLSHRPAAYKPRRLAGMERICNT